MNKRYAITGVIVAAVLVAGILWYRSTQTTASSGDMAVENARAKGPVNAPVTINEYSDFECPACKKAQPVLNDIMQEFDGKVRLNFHHFPLSGHRWAGPAHQAGECAARQNLFWPYHDRLYDMQSIWSSLPNPLDAFFRYAKEAGLNLQEFADCMSSQEVRRTILDEKGQGEVLKVNSTPTFFINGERFVGGIDLENKGRKHIQEILGVTPAAETKAS